MEPPESHDAIAHHGILVAGTGSPARRLPADTANRRDPFEATVGATCSFREQQMVRGSPMPWIEPDESDHERRDGDYVPLMVAWLIHPGISSAAPLDLAPLDGTSLIVA